MILKFPDLDTVRLALTSGAVPPAVSQAAATVGIDEAGPVWVETAAPVPRAAQNDLRRLGIQVCKASGAAVAVPVRCWPEILPLRPDPDPLDRLEQTPILFETASQDGLGRLVVEVLRLGNDRQGFRWLDGKNDDDGRGLLRVVGPPYYSLLRAIDRTGPEAPRAYRERAPQVWVEVGWMHPLADHLKPPPGKLLLAGAPRSWTLIDEAPFRDVYEVMEFALPDCPSDWNEGGLTGKVRAALRLTAGGSAEGAELWVLRDGAVEELNRFVQASDDQMLHRLAFAVGEKDGRTIVVLRVRHSKLPPPELVLKAEAYKTYLKLPNLFLPAGKALHPPLRRDMVRRLLADDAAQVVWLTSLDDGGFRPETLPEDAFRPLIDWIDYVLDHESEPLQAWVQAAQFDFEAFICDEDLAAKPKKPPAAPPPRRGKKKGDDGDDGPEMPAGPLIEYVDKSRRPGDDKDEEAFTVEKVEPSELQRQRQALEEQFLALEGGLDAPERQALWPQLAGLNAALGDPEEAGLCWLHALWGRDSISEDLAWRWFCTEAAAVPVRPDSGSRNRSWASRLTTAAGRGREIEAADLDRLLGRDDPTASDLRAFAAYLVWSVRRESPPQAIVQRLNAVQRFLETHERLLPVRAMWLAWSHLVRLSRGDVLALARARDRLLERLFTNGLRPEQDLLGFLRFAGPATSQRFRGVGQWLIEMAEKARNWVGSQGVELTTLPAYTPRTREYSDLLFAYGLARLGERDACLQLRDRAAGVLADEDVAHYMLLEGFTYRIQQALDGKAVSGPLPAQMLADLEKVREDRKAQSRQTDSQAPDHAYMVERMRELSRVFEPDQKVDPYRHTTASSSSLDAALAQLPDVQDKADAVDRIERLLQSIPKAERSRSERGQVVRAALDLAPRVGEEFARRFLNEAVPLFDALASTSDPNVLAHQVIPLLEKALFVAASFDSIEHVHALVNCFRKLLQAQHGAPQFQTLDLVAKQCFRGLRKLGMREEVDQLLGQTAQIILRGQVFAEYYALSDPNGGALRSLLYVAAGWLYLGQEHRAEPVLLAARSLLFRNELVGIHQAALACAYITAVGQAAPETTQQRLQELLDRLENVRDAFGTNNHYSMSQLRVIEAVVLAIVSDDFALGANARRWLDDDEYLVRRRVHAEYRAVMAHG